MRRLVSSGVIPVFAVFAVFGAFGCIEPHDDEAMLAESDGGAGSGDAMLRDAMLRDAALHDAMRHDPAPHDAPHDEVCPHPEAGLHERVRVGDVVFLEGRDQDPQGRLPVAWEWVVVERPEGSTSQVLEALFDSADPAAGGLSDDVQSPGALIFADLPGRYVLELRTRNREGCQGTDTLRFDAISDLEVTLREGPDAELDLEVGVEGDDDVCRPDHDPSWGWCHLQHTEGGERVTASRINDGERTLVVRVVYRDGEGPVEAPVTVQVRGGVVVEAVARLAAPGEVHEVLRVAWPSGEVLSP